MVVLDALVVVTALPRIQQDLNVGLDSLQWTVNAYGIAVAAGIITATVLGDRFGRRRLFVIGLTLFTLASAACALAPDVAILIAARTVQGLGGAIVTPISLTILSTAFPPEKRGQILGIYGGLAGLAVASGPVIGGALTQSIDWHWIFWVNVPLGAAGALLSTRFLPESFGPPRRLDIPGVLLVSAGSIALVWGLVRANGSGWGSAEIAGTLAAGAMLLAAFFRWERKAAVPILPIKMLANRNFAYGNATGFLMSGAIFGGAFLVAQWFQFGLGYSPLETGVRLLPWTMTPIFVAPLAGAFSDRIGRRPLIVTGLALQSLGFAWIALRASSSVSIVELMLALFVAGIGVSMAIPTVPTAIISSVSPPEMGTASGVNSMTQRFGSVFAVAIASAVFASYGSFASSADVTSGFRPALAVCALLSLLGASTGLALRKRIPAVELEPVPAGATT
jgi:EmrB/QacA subfamily drug resistance transporter